MEPKSALSRFPIFNTDKFHYITNAGTSFAVMAIKACE